MKHLDPCNHRLHLKRLTGENTEYCVPPHYEYMREQIYDEIEVLPLNIYNVHLSRTGGTGDFGFAVTGQIDGQYLNRIFVTEVLPDGLAYSKGLRGGDEILVLNGEAVSSLDLRQMESLFTETNVMLTLRTDHAHQPMPMSTLLPSLLPPANTIDTRGQKAHLPPSNQSQLLEEFLDSLTENTASDLINVPDVTTSITRSSADNTLDRLRNGEKADHHLKSAEQGTTLCHSLHEMQSCGMEGQKEAPEPPLKPLPRHLSSTERLRKVIQELVDTEKSYVKDLSCLFEIYLDPLQNETFLTQDEMESLFGSLPEMLEFQKVFLQTLEDGIASSPNFTTLETPSQFRKLLFSLGGSFLYYADHFKLYSGFCANHIKVQKVLERAKTDQAFKEFLDARNPTKQHSSTLESYLIKPVQRVLKYPLLLRELVSITDPDSEERYHLTEALKAMEKVASHINEMQKIYEDYGTVFDQLVAEQSGVKKEVTELSMGELLMHSAVSWLNPFPSLGRLRKDPELTIFVFKRAVILVYKENYKIKKKLPTNPRSAHGHGDMDPFKFRWLIPLSALQVRLGNAAGTDTNCIWDLIHTKSEVEGRPETVFQLCSSDPESKTNIIKVIRSILRENFRRNITKCDLPLEKASREHLVPLRNRLPTSAKLGSSRASRLLKHSALGDWNKDTSKGNLLDSDDGSLSSSTHSSGCHTIDSGQESKSPTNLNHSHVDTPYLQDDSVKESDILSDDEDSCHTTVKKDSPVKDIEVHFQRLTISDKLDISTEQGAPCQPDTKETELEEEKPKLVRAHFCPIKRKSNSVKQNREILLAMQEHHRSLDSQSENANMDLILQREFSVQSLTSVVNEDCFYEPVENLEKKEMPAP
nr:PREDICTED: T-lymphoma invasion and metastasis-inducing protein 2 isoform X2 [Latimeria chalumnae]|eukprot:XP_006004415.1 PREDICTED: T-lymphoma invasion and metastasis-inducing protein 2 isoform X2 [Latimeria chalumnae]